MESETEPLDNGVTEIHTLDVGQADAHLVVTDEGELILIDANVEELDEKIDTALSGRKVEQTASEKIPLTFAVTHLHNDHVKGLESLIGDYEIQTAAEPSQNDTLFGILIQGNQRMG